MSAKRLNGTVVMVTGAASGLGLASCERFAAEGARVICVDLSEDAARQVAERLPTQAVGISADVCRPQDMERAVEVALAAAGRIDVLFANAGVTGEGAAHDLAIEEWRRVISTNLDGVFFSVRAVLPTMMQQRSGSLILQSSAAGLKGMANLASYSAAKAGVLGLMRQVAVEYAPYGIRCNAICPGTIVTPLVEKAYTERFGEGGAAEALARRGGDYPLKRLGLPEDVAAYAAYLASDEANWVSGTAQSIDGGLVSRL